MNRQPILFFDSRETMLAMAEGNVGAMAVIDKCRELIIDTLKCSTSDYLEILKSLDTMNMRGIQIWIAFNDYAEKDMPTFLRAVQSFDPKMIDFLNNFPNAAFSGEKPIAVNPLQPHDT